MKFISTARLAALILLGAFVAIPAVADKQGHGKKEHHEKRNQAKPDHHGNHPHRTSQQSHEWQHNRGWQKHGGWQGTKEWHGGRAHHWHEEHRTWHQRGGYGGYYIAGPSFSLYFGSGHAFRIQSRPVIYRGYPRFYHHGYSFILVDPYPETWEDDWYETDEVYIDYDDGYYLYNRSRPGFALAVTIVR